MSVGTNDLLPRNSYFNAEDRQQDKEAFRDGVLEHEQRRRAKFVLNAIQDAENLIGALKAARPFDRLGNIEHALPQIADALADVIAKTNNFLTDVETAGNRYRRLTSASDETAGGQRVETAAAFDGPDGSAAAASTPEGDGGNIAHFDWSDLTVAPMPKPGPHLATVTVFDPNVSQKDQLAALDAKVAERWGGGRR